MAKPFVSSLKQNISSRFESHVIVSVFSIFDPQEIQVSYLHMEEPVQVLIGHYAQNRPALMLNDEETMKEGLITTEMWITYCKFLMKKHEDTTFNN